MSFFTDWTVKMDARPGESNAHESFQIHSAIMSTEVEVIKREHVPTAAEHDANVSLGSITEDNALHRAIRNNNIDDVKVLLLNGSDPNTPNDEINTPLGQAILFVDEEVKQIELVELLISKGADIHMKGMEGRTVLHMAVEKGKVKTAAFLLNEGINPNSQDDYNNSPLHDAIWFIDDEDKQKEILDLLISSGADIHLRGHGGKTALHVAATKARSKIVLYLLDKGISPNSQDDRIYSPLHSAIWFVDDEDKQQEIINLLISKGADIHLRGHRGRSALHMAVSKARIKTARFLLDEGISPNCQDDRNNSPLHDAIWFIESEDQQIEIVDYLISKEADMSMKGPGGRTVLHMAVERSRLKTVQFLLDEGISPNSQNDYNNSPLHDALRLIDNEHKQIEMVDLLILKGADIHLRGVVGKSALHMAAEKARSKVAQHLLDAGICPNCQDDHQYSPIHDAIRFIDEDQQMKMIGLLISKGANIHLRGRVGKTALHVAAKKARSKVAHLLLDEGACPNCQDDHKNSPLHAAVWLIDDEEKQLDMVNLLISKGADIHLRGQGRRTALHMAAGKARLKTAQILLNEGIDPNSQDDRNNSPLEAAICYIDDEDKHQEMIDLLISKGADIHMKEQGGRSALQMAVYRARLKTARFLLDEGINPNSQDDHKNSPLHDAICYIDDEDILIEMIILLISKGADIHLRGHGGRTVLHMAAEKARIKTAQFLSNKGISCDSQDDINDTPLQSAIIGTYRK